VGPDSGSEIVRLVDGAESPTGRPLLAVSNEISGTVSLWSLDCAREDDDDDHRHHGDDDDHHGW
jgi:hypothetical protein